GQREQLVAFERHASRAWKRERGRLRGCRFVQRRLRAEERLDEELRTRRSEPRLEQHVDRVMPGIRFMTCEIERAADRQRERRIHTHTAREAPFVARERAPRQLAHVLDLHTFAGGQRYVRTRRGAAALDGP